MAEVERITVNVNPWQPYVVMDGDTGDGAEVFHAPTLTAAQEYAEAYCRDGNWGDGGFSVSCHLYRVREIDDDSDDSDIYTHNGVSYTLADPPDDFGVSVDIPSVEPRCIDGGEHRLTDGGDEFGGVRGGAGTQLTVTEYCLLCGGTRVHVQRGTQRNPGEADYVRWNNDLDEATWLALRDDASLPTQVVEVCANSEEQFPGWWSHARVATEFPDVFRRLIESAYGEIAVTRDDADAFFAVAADIEGWDGDDDPRDHHPVSRRPIEMPGVARCSDGLG